MRLLLLIAIALPSCAIHDMQRTDLAHAALCRQTGSPDLPTYLVRSTAVPGDLPLAVPYIALAGVGDMSHESLAKKIPNYLEEMGWPDIIIWDPEGSQTTGAVSSYLGFGLSTTSLVTQQAISAVALRVAQTSLGLRLGSDSMVMHVHDDARASGILEGDRLVSVDGLEVQTGPNAWGSAHYQVMLRGKVGQPVQLVWIRPGTGRMEGTSTLLPNDRSRLQSLPIAERPRTQYRRVQRPLTQTTRFR
jgi:hypothetical protein